MAVSHVFTSPIADFTGTVTVFNSLGSTATTEASAIVRPSNWNSAHNQYMTISGNTAGASTASGTNLVLQGGNNVTLSVTDQTIVFSASLGLTSQSNQAFSAGAASSAFQTLVFQDSNGVSFSNNAGSVRVTHDLQFTSATSAITANALNTSASRVINIVAATNNTAGGTASLSSNVSFSAANGITFYTSAGNAVVASYSVPTVTNSSWSVSDAATSGTVARLAFTNINGVTLSLSSGANGSHTIVGSHNALTSQSNQAFSAGAASSAFQTLIFQDSLNLSFSNNAGSVRVTHNLAGTSTGFAGANVSGSMTMNSSGLNLSLSVAAPGAAAEQNAINLLGANTAGNTTATGSTIGLSGLNMTLSGTNASQIVLSVPATSSLVGASGMSISTAGSTISIYEPAISSYEPFPLQSNIVLTFNGASISHGAAFILQRPVSASFIRIPVVMTTNSTTIATIASATATASASIVSTFNAVVYSMGAGASSKSLISVASGSAGFTFRQSISITNTTQASYTLGYSAQAQGGGTTRTTQYSISNTNYSFTTNQIATEFSGSRFIDIPFASSLSPGAYWIVMGMSTASGSAGPAGLAAMTNVNVRYSNHYGISQANINFGVMGSTNLTSGGLMGAGSFSTAGGGTTSGFPISAISSSASNVRPYFQLLRSA